MILNGHCKVEMWMLAKEGGEMTRNTMDEDWDERRDAGKDVPEYGC